MRPLAPEEDATGHGTAQVVDLRAWKELGILASPSDMREAQASAAGSDCRAREVDQQDMTETIITLRIVHQKPLPKDAERTIANRAYDFLYARGVEVSVIPLIAEVPKEIGSDGQPS
jgi:hypothetical protein